MSFFKESSMIMSIWYGGEGLAAGIYYCLMVYVGCNILYKWEVARDREL